MGTMIYLILAQAVVFAVMVIGIRQLLLSDT